MPLNESKDCRPCDFLPPLQRSFASVCKLISRVCVCVCHSRYIFHTGKLLRQRAPHVFTRVTSNKCARWPKKSDDNHSQRPLYLSICHKVACSWGGGGERSSSNPAHIAHLQSQLIGHFRIFSFFSSVFGTRRLSAVQFRACRFGYEPSTRRSQYMVILLPIALPQSSS